MYYLHIAPQTNDQTTQITIYQGQVKSKKLFINGYEVNNVASVDLTAG